MVSADTGPMPIFANTSTAAAAPVTTLTPPISTHSVHDACPAPKRRPGFCFDVRVDFPPHLIPRNSTTEPPEPNPGGNSSDAASKPHPRSGNATYRLFALEYECRGPLQSGQN